MRNFCKLAANVNVGELWQSLGRQPELWNQNTLRTKHPQTPHSQVDDIWLRFNDVSKYKEVLAGETGKSYEELQAIAGVVLDEHESINYPALALLPQARPIIFNLLRLVEGERLGRVMITRMRPGARIAPHVDGGTHAAYYDRYHVALQVLPGVVFRCGDEVAPMSTGDVWWFNNAVEHEVVNNSAEDRVTLIIDIRTAHGASPA